MANTAPKAPHAAGIWSALTTATGIILAASAQVTKVAAVAQATGIQLPGWVTVTGLGLAAVGGTLQAVTKPVHAGNTDLVPKQE